MWISPEFKIFIVKEFQRLKEEEHKVIGWSVKRELSKINYHIHTDAVRANLIPAEVDAYHSSLIYAEEADVLNVALSHNHRRADGHSNYGRMPLCRK